MIACEISTWVQLDRGGGDLESVLLERHCELHYPPRPGQHLIVGKRTAEHALAVTSVDLRLEGDVTEVCTESWVLKTQLDFETALATLKAAGWKEEIQDE